MRRGLVINSNPEYQEEKLHDHGAGHRNARRAVSSARRLEISSPYRANSAQRWFARVRERYVSDILGLHDRLSYRGLLRELACGDRVLYQADRGWSLGVVAARTTDIPERYLLGLSGFRLSQYLRAGFASHAVVFGHSLFCEPLHHIAPDDIHVCVMDMTQGRILGYAALAHSQDPQPRRLDAPDRVLFPSEQVHGLRLLDKLGGTGHPEPTTHQVREVKRLMHNHSMTDRSLRLRVTLELLAGISAALCHPATDALALVGDVEKHIALRHLVLLGLDVELVEGTEPRIPLSDLMHPRYSDRGNVHPFVARLPPVEEGRKRVRAVEQAAAANEPFRAVRELLACSKGKVRSVGVGT